MTIKPLDELQAELVRELDEAERKAWDSLARYKFQMFGYWAAIWVHINRLSGLRRPNPWKCLIETARQEMPDSRYSDSEAAAAAVFGGGQ